MKPILTLLATAMLLCVAGTQQALAQYGDARHSAVYRIGQRDAAYPIDQQDGVYHIGEQGVMDPGSQRSNVHPVARRDGGYHIGEQNTSYHIGNRDAFDHLGQTNESGILGEDLTACSGGCDAACDSGCNTCFSPACCCSTTWVSFEYLLWLRQDRRLPVLVTTAIPGTPLNAGPPNFTPIAGALGQGTTRTLFGGNRVDDGAKSGGRISLGRWLCGEQVWGVGGRFFALGKDEVGFTRASDAAGQPTLARPFFNTDPGVNAQDAFMVAFNGPIFPGDPSLPRLRGDITATQTNDVLGGEAFLRKRLDCGPCYNLDLIGGYHFTRIDDALQVASNSIVIDPAFGPPGTTFALTDRFSAKNEFHGGELGLMAAFRDGPWTLSLMGKGSLGNMRQTVAINGTTFINGVLVRNSGLLAQSTNSGTFERDRLVFVPEGEFNLAYQLNDCLAVSVGVSGIYWTSVALAGDQVDTNIDGRLLGPVPPAAPSGPNFQFRSTDFWVGGLNFGLHGTF